MISVLSTTGLEPGQLLALWPWALAIVTFAIGWGVAARRRASVRPEDLPLYRGMGVPTYLEKLPDFYRELERVRRYERRLAVLVAKLDEEEMAAVESALQGGGAKGGGQDLVVACGLQVVFARVGHILRDFVRDIDITCWDVVNRRYIVLLPEVGRDEADGMVSRLEGVVFQATGVRVAMGFSEFRTDGLVIEDLVEKATAAARRRVSDEILASVSTQGSEAGNAGLESAVSARR